VFFDTGLPETEGVRGGVVFRGDQPYTVYNVVSLGGLHEDLATTLAVGQIAASGMSALAAVPAAAAAESAEVSTAVTAAEKGVSQQILTKSKQHLVAGATMR
jgi:hypothetical protein